MKPQEVDMDVAFRVTDGVAWEAFDIPVPTLSSGEDDELRWQAFEAGWELFTGYTGQCGYNGPLMHPSEYIGGQLERDILQQDGVYAALSVLDEDGGDGWVVARRIA